jgi:glycosyltransferase involved in cell wall biosynthesis
MRVLMLTELYPPHIGGSEQHVRNLALGLLQRGHDVVVATTATGDNASTDDDEGVRVHRVRSTTQRFSGVNQTGRPYLPPFPDPDVVSALAEILEEERPEIVHAHNWMIHSFLPLKAMSSARVAMTLHDYGIACAKKSLIWRERPCSGPEFAKCLRCAARHYGTARGEVITLGNWATRWPLRRVVDGFLPVSAAVARGNELDEMGVRYRVIPNFVPDGITDAGADQEASPLLEQLPREAFWLYVGTLSHHKGVGLLLDAYARMPGAPPLVLIGRRSADGPRSYPPNATVLLDLPQPLVMAAWRRASVGFVPSRFPDPCPTVALEAMACGVPLVAAATGGLPELVDDGVTGLLFEVGDANKLAAAMSEVCVDPARLVSMSAASRRRATEFMAGSVIPRIESFYGELLA